MRSIHVDIRHRKIRVRLREWYGVDRPDWSTVDELSPDQARWLAESLIAAAAEVEKNPDDPA